jgi:hypothetical protein
VPIWKHLAEFSLVKALIKIKQGETQAPNHEDNHKIITRRKIPKIYLEPLEQPFAKAPPNFRALHSL